MTEEFFYKTSIKVGKGSGIQYIFLVKKVDALYNISIKKLIDIADLV